MKQTTLKSIITFSLTVITLVIVAVTQSANTIMLNQYPELVMYGLLTAFALYFSIQMVNSELGMAHVVGMMALLAYPPLEVSGLILLVIFTGGLSGGILMALRSYLQRPSQRRVRANIYTLIHVTARVTISYFIVANVYIQSGAYLPLNDTIASSPLSNILGTLILFAITYLAVYVAIYALQLYAEDFSVDDIFRNNLAIIIVVLAAPVPFAVLVAVAPPISESIVSFAIVIAGTLFSLFGLHVISRMTQRTLKQLNEMRALSRMSYVLTGNLKLQSLYPALYQQIQSLMVAQNFKVVLYHEDTKQIEYAFVIHNSQQQAINKDEQADDHQFIQRVIVTRQPLCLQDNVQDQALLKGLVAPAHLVSWLGVPLLSGHQVIGALIVSSYQADQHFSAVDEHLLTIISGTASVAIENARLYEQKSQRAEELTILNKVAILLSGTLHPNELIDTVISSLSTITDAHAVSIYLPSTSTNKRLRYIRSAGLSDNFHENPPQPQIIETLSDTLDYNQLKPTIVENIVNIGKDVTLRSYMVAEKKQAWVEIPLKLNKESFGIIAAYYNEPQIFTVEQIRLMEAFATQAAQAINNAETYSVTDKALEVRVEQLYALAAMGRLLNATMDSKQICNIILNYAGDATKADRGFVALFCLDGDKMDICSVREYDPSLISLNSLSQGINGRVINTKQAFRSDDIRQETGYLPLIPNTRSLLIVPLMRGKELLGILRLESNIVRAFTDGDAHFVSQLTNQALVAMDNTQLFQHINTARNSLQTILDGMEDAILMINTEKIITIANPPITMLGLDPEKILNQPVQNLLKDDTFDLPACLGFDDEQALIKVLDNLNHSTLWRNQLTHEYNITTEDGTRTFIKRSLIPVRSNDDQAASGILMVFYNKTEEHQLIQARDSLSQMIVHDLRSPLTAVTTSLALLRSLSNADDKLKPIIDKTTSASHQAIQKVLSRINSLLDISKMESGNIDIHAEPTELTTIVDNVLIELSPLAHEMNISLKNKIGDTLPLLMIDSDKIERVLQNLVDNALKYSPRNSEVILRTSKYDSPLAERIRIDIIDTGPGIPDNYKKSVFQRYTQIDGRDIVRSGIGLGLAFCQMITEAHGGKIWIEDNPDGGSIFSLTLPIISQQQLTDNAS